MIEWHLIKRVNVMLRVYRPTYYSSIHFLMQNGYVSYPINKCFVHLIISEYNYPHSGYKTSLSTFITNGQNNCNSIRNFECYRDRPVDELLTKRWG